MKKEIDMKIKQISSSIERHELNSYTAYRIKGRSTRSTFIRFYKNKTTIAFPYNKIEKEIKEKYDLKDNSDRYPRHELQTKGPALCEKYLEEDFIQLVEKAYKKIKEKLNL